MGSSPPDVMVEASVAEATEVSEVIGDDCARTVAPKRARERANECISNAMNG